MVQKSSGVVTAEKNAYYYAKSKNLVHVSADHLFLALLNDAIIKDLIQKLGLNVDDLRTEMESFLEAYDQNFKYLDSKDPEQTTTYLLVLQRAAAKGGMLETQDVLRSIFMQPHGAGVAPSADIHAIALLKKHGFESKDIIDLIDHGRIPSKSLSGGSSSKSDSGSSQDFLGQYAANLNILASRGKIDPATHRDAETERVIEILKRRRKSNPVLIGEAGVGKTAIVEGLAHRINSGDVPDFLRTAVIYSLDITALNSGTQYRGDFEMRIKGVIEQLKTIPNARLFVDEVHMLIGAGAASGSSMDAANILKPALARGEISMISATTITEYRKYIEKDPALARRMQAVMVNEPTPEQAIAMIREMAQFMEFHHGVSIQDDAIDAAVRLTHRHIHDRFLPDKAIDILDETLSAMALIPGDERPESITGHDIARKLGKTLGIPIRIADMDERTHLKSLNQRLKKSVFGQDAAIDSITTSYINARLGFGTRHENKPLGVYLLDGPSGVGKTLTAQTLADMLGLEMVRLDMSEYHERHTINRLIGAPPGYVGHEDGGQLTNPVLNRPNCLLLLDEMDKAHPDVHKLFLSIFDDGRITDTQGRKIDFSKCVIVMTSNAGANAKEKKNSIGFVSEDEDTLTKDPSAGTRPAANAEEILTLNESDLRSMKGGQDAVVKSGLSDIFSPEFLGRSRIVEYKNLGTTHIQELAKERLEEIRANAGKRGISLSYSAVVPQYLAQRCLSSMRGARPLDEMLDSAIVTPLTAAFIDAQLDNGSHVHVKLVRDQGAPRLTMDFSKAADAGPANDHDPLGRRDMHRHDSLPTRMLA